MPHIGLASEKRPLYSILPGATLSSNEHTQSPDSYHHQPSISPGGHSSALDVSPCTAGPDASHSSTASTTGESDVPPCSVTLSKASSEMSIEAMLLWPIFEQHLSSLTRTSLLEDLGQVPSITNPSLSHGTQMPAAGEALNLDHNTVRQLIENFLVNNLPKNPILNPVSLRRDGQEFVDSGIRWDGESCLFVSPPTHTRSKSKNANSDDDYSCLSSPLAAFQLL